jgi:Na+/H+ antiporter NhaD/arsenite permease-like protein
MAIPNLLAPLDRQQLAKATTATVAIVVLLGTNLPHEIGILVLAALLLVSRRVHTRAVLAQVDWPLILLFACLFAVNAAFRDTGLPAQGLAWLDAHGLLPDRLAVMAPSALTASNTIGNVPAVIMLLSVWHGSEGAFYALALLSTLAGNLLLVGSLANIIVAERAASVGLHLPFRDHARCGIPMTLLSMAGAIAWLGAGGWLPW